MKPKKRTQKRIRAAKRQTIRPPTKPAAQAGRVERSPYRLGNDKLEEALLTGRERDLLETYFGEAGCAELQELARKASQRSVRGGPRVLILPGIMGSKIGRERFLFDDVIWVDPADIALGNLKDLSMARGQTRHTALGVILLAYLKLKFRLQIAGFDADFYPFDWRQNFEHLGRELAHHLAREKASEISLVAHSMGGLVSRAALKAGAGKVKRLIMLGTPNYGSFVPTQAMRGTYSVTRKVAALDLVHSIDELTEQVFNTFPGLYQMLPAPEKFSALDLFNLNSWPSRVPRPRADLLRLARASQDWFAPPDARFHLIAGINQETAVDLRLRQDEFAYTFSREGDGTVPLALAQLPGVRTYFIEESHGSLPNNRIVAQAVVDLLRQGETDLLPRSWTPRRGAATATRGEQALREAVPAAPASPERGKPSPSEIRQLLEEVASAEARDAGTPPLSAAPPELDRVVVSRRRQHRLDFQLAQGSIAEVNSRACVLGLFRDVTPTGAAQAVDARLEGALAEFTQRRMFSGNVGELFLLPTGRCPLRFDTVLFAGLGSFDHFKPEVLDLVAENVIRTLIRTNVEEFATVLIGGASGQSTTECVRHLLRGFFRGLIDADQNHQFRRVTLCEWDPRRYQEIKSELFRLSGSELFAEIEATFDEIQLPAPLEAPCPARGLASAADAPVYLLVRQEQNPNGPLEYQASVLTAGSKATVLTARKSFHPKQLESHLKQLETLPFGKLDSFGINLSKLILDDAILSVLPSLRQRHLVVVHDAQSSRIPWETVRIGSWAPAAAAGLSRRYLAANLSVAKWLEQRRHGPVLDLLLVVNPTGDLEGAEAEGDRIRQLFGSHPSVNLVERRGAQARKRTLLQDFSSGQYDVIHYAGHAYFDPLHPSRSGILCHGQEVLSGAELTGLGSLPSLIFFNACESGRIRRWADVKKKLLPVQDRILQNVSMAEAFLRGGAANYVGTYWPVGDASAKIFAEIFYGRLLAGGSLGQAMQAGRQAVRQRSSIDWADYILYGSHEFVVKEKKERS